METYLQIIEADSAVNKQGRFVAVKVHSSDSANKFSAKKNHNKEKDSSSTQRSSINAVSSKLKHFKKAPIDSLTRKNELVDTASSDSVLKAKVLIQKVEVVKNLPKKPLPQFFIHHKLQVHHTNPIPVSKEPADWIFFSLLFIMSAFTITKVLHNRNFKQMRDAFFSTTISNQIIRDENLLFQRASIFLTVVFYLSAALLLYHVSVVYQWNDKYLSSGFGRFFIFILITSLVYSAKLIVLKAIGFILKIEKPVNIYIFNVFLVNNIVGVLLIPILISLSYMGHYSYHIMLYSAFVLVGSAYIYRLLRGVFMGNSRFSPYYIILYLCTLEIAPLLFFAKLLIK